MDLQKIGLKRENVTFMRHWYEKTCAVCGEMAKSEARLTPYGELVPEEAMVKESDEFTRHLMQRGWSTSPPLCKKCRTALVLQAIEDMLPKGGDGK